MTFNRFYLRDGAEKVQQLRETFKRLVVEYADDGSGRRLKKKVSLVQDDPLQDALTPVGTAVDQPAFASRSRYTHDQLKGKIVRNLVATGVTRLPEETEPVIVIRFSILDDGTVVSDSNYIPRDVHDRADYAMASLDLFFGSKRREGYEIRRKRIPEAYRDKAYCSPKEPRNSFKSCSRCLEHRSFPRRRESVR